MNTIVEGATNILLQGVVVDGDGNAIDISTSSNKYINIRHQATGAYAKIAAAFVTAGADGALKATPAVTFWATPGEVWWGMQYDLGGVTYRSVHDVVLVEPSLVP